MCYSYFKYEQIVSQP